MSDHIPLELQSEIMSRLPVKSLIKFRSVCKAWKSPIGSSDFIAHYSSQQQHLLVRYEDAEDKYVSVVDDDDSFPHQKVSVTIPQLAVDLLTNNRKLASSHGLLCLFGYHLLKAVIWNPSISKDVDVIMPDIIVPDMVDEEMYRRCTSLNYGFGVCRETTDPKIVKITMDKEGLNPCQVEVFTLGKGAWRSLSSSNLPRNSVTFYDSQVVVDGVLYWLACDRSGNGCYKLIVSFDMTSEEFEDVHLPDRLAPTNCSLSMYKLRESLVVIESSLEDYKVVLHVWMMEDGDPKTFEKLYTISSPSPNVSIVSVKGFRKNGEPLVELQTNPGSTRMLAAYEPYSKSISDVGINGRHFSVYSYVETLLLL